MIAPDQGTHVVIVPVNIIVCIVVADTPPYREAGTAQAHDPGRPEIWPALCLSAIRGTLTHSIFHIFHGVPHNDEAE